MSVKNRGDETGHDAAASHREDAPAMEQPAGNAEPRLGTTPEKEAKPGLGAPWGETGTAPMGWFSRGYLPHFDSFGVVQSIAFRLADTLPQEKLRRLKQELAARPKTVREWNPMHPEKR